MTEKQSYKTPSYSDARALLDKALQTDKGLCVELPTKAEAFFLRQKLNKVRYQYRKESRKLYEEEHYNFGTSPWDELCFNEELLDEDKPEGRTKLFIISGEEALLKMDITIL